MAAKLTIGFLGAGKMATALAKGFLGAGLVSQKDLIASDVSSAAREVFSKQTSARIGQNNVEVAKSASVLILAVKPHQVPEVLENIRDKFTSNHLLVSIAAGVPLAKLESGLASGARVIRVMPNTPALIGESKKLGRLPRGVFTISAGPLQHA